jgi:hypothetical protein
VEFTTDFNLKMHLRPIAVQLEVGFNFDLAKQSSCSSAWPTSAPTAFEIWAVFRLASSPDTHTADFSTAWTDEAVEEIDHHLLGQL